MLELMYVLILKYYILGSKKSLSIGHKLSPHSRKDSVKRKKTTSKPRNMVQPLKEAFIRRDSRCYGQGLME
jgi:hypothetical protein